MKIYTTIKKQKEMLKDADNLSASAAVKARTVVPEADIERYRQYAQSMGLEGPRLSDAIKQCVRLMKPFVDAAFGDDPVQHCLIAAQKTGRTQKENASLVIESSARALLSAPQPDQDRG